AGPHVQRLADRVDGLLGTHGDHGHDRNVVTARRLLLDLQGLLHGVLVELREQPVHADAVNGVVRLELPVGSGVGNVFHTDNNVHGGVAGEGPSCALDVCGEVTSGSYASGTPADVGSVTGTAVPHAPDPEPSGAGPARS